MGDAQPSQTCMDVVVAVVHRRGKILICQRRDDAEHLAGYWEFPGGKRELHETIETCCQRELLEEVALRVTVLRSLAPVEHAYPTRRVKLIPLVCETDGGEPTPIACQRLEWVAPGDLHKYRFPPPNERLIAEIIEALTPAGDDPSHLI